MEPGLDILFTPGWAVGFSELLLCFCNRREVGERSGGGKWGGGYQGCRIRHYAGILVLQEYAERLARHSGWGGC